MIPVKTKNSNFVYQGGHPEIHDLHCQVEEIDGGRVVKSTWVLTPEERMRVANGENITLSVFTNKGFPPVFLYPDKVELVSSKCGICGKEPDDAVHQNHVYRARKL